MTESVATQSSPSAARANLIALLTGAIFGIGLAVSGLSDPQRVLGFLDIAGSWDPTLMFVMGSAVGTHALWLRFGPKRDIAEQPRASRVDSRILLGSAVFGVGWGLSGYCPGPSLVALLGIPREGLVFVPALLVGSLIAGWLNTRAAQRA